MGTQPASIFERHAQSAVLLICTALMLYVGKSVTDNAVYIARLEERVVQLVLQVEKLEAKIEKVTVKQLSG